MKKDDPIQKNINNFFATQSRRQTHEANKSNSKSHKGTAKSNKRRNKKNTT